MRPRLVDFFVEKLGTGIFVPDYAFLQAIAMVLGLYLMIRQAEKTGLDSQSVFRAGLMTVGFALLSARFYIVFQDLNYYIRQPGEILQYWKGGTASFGAYIGGFLAAILAAKWQRLTIPKFLDCCAPAVALAIVLGRLGCFLNGCCFGRESDLTWALRFPEGSGPYYAQLRDRLIAPHDLTLPVHPTQLYEAVYAFGLFFILIKCRQAQRYDGELFALLFILYPLGRFLNEFLRGDDRGAIFIFSLPQFFCIVAIILSVSFFVIKNRRASFAPISARLNL